MEQPQLGLSGWLRFFWRQLTSMRTALLLLLLLAVAAIPGSILPQRGVDPARVADYLQKNPQSGPWLDRLSGFDVYSSPWFSAIYLLLFTSLIGCVGPRSRQHWRALRSRPPKTPARLDRLPVYQNHHLDQSIEQSLAAALVGLGRRRFRIEVVRGEGEITVSAERGYLRETGNLVFHLSLIVVLLGVAAGHLWGWHGDVALPVGQPWSNTANSYDEFSPGPWVNPEALPAFSFTVRNLAVQFETDTNQRGAPRMFRAAVDGQSADGQAQTNTVEVNNPLTIDDATISLLGNGYAPVVTVRDSKGDVAYSQATIFPPQDANYVSSGVIKVPGAQPKQLGIEAVFLPTAKPNAPRPTSLFPDALNPQLFIAVYEGDLGLSSAPKSVFELDRTKMKPLTLPDGRIFTVALSPGQTVRLPEGKGSVTFDRLQRFAGLNVRHDPGRGWALGGAIAAMIGMSISLFVPRRRIFLRLRTKSPGQTTLEIAGLARGEDSGLAAEIERILTAVRGSSGLSRNLSPTEDSRVS
jgi:cytochrome c biogenesis protein